MYCITQLGIVYGPYGGVGYFERPNQRAAKAPFRFRRLLKYLASLLA